MCLRGLGGQGYAGPTFVAWCGEGKGDACAGGEKTCRDGNPMPAPSLMALDAENGSSKEAGV